MTDADLKAHADAIERAAKYAETSGDKMAAHLARQGLASLEISVRAADAWKREAKIDHGRTLEQLTVARRERHAALEEVENYKARLETCRARCNEALASVIRARAPQSIGGAVLQLAGAVVSRVRR